MKTALRVFVNQGDGRFRHAPELVEGAIEARYPIVVADDFNGDAQVDLAIFDYGVYVYDDSLGYGNPPQLLLSGHDGRFRPSDALAAAVAREHERQSPPEGSSGPGDLHLKSATSGDIDGDGDIDLWVQSGGGANVEETFIVNNGDGTFAVERSRVPLSVLANHPPDYWGFAGSELVDVDNDGDPDLALGQTRDLGPLVVNQFSIVLLNDGTGQYPSRIELPHPVFNEGYTAVGALTHFDVNGDGFQDLWLLHERNNDALPDVLPFTGRYIQVLVNRGGTSFDDETFAWMGDQSATTPERGADGEPLSNFAEPAMHDVDGDGCLDLVMSRSLVRVRTDSPLVYRNDGSGRFQALPPEPFGDFSFYAVPADVNGDAAIDFVVLERDDGPDGLPRTRDDFSTLVTQLNTTPEGLTRCSRRVAAVGTLPSRTLSVGAVASAVVVPLADAFRHASFYAAFSSAPRVAAVCTHHEDYFASRTKFILYAVPATESTFILDFVRQYKLRRHFEL